MIADVLAEGRLIRKAWGRKEDGRQLLCLYTALIGDPKARPETCPADVCPTWLAHLLPWIDDSGTEAHWPDVVARVARLAPSFATLPTETEWHVRALCIREAMRHTTDADVLAVCERVATLCETRVPDAGELRDAEAEAWAAAMKAKAWAANAPAAARAAMTAVAVAASTEAEAATKGAAWAEEAAAAAWAAMTAVAWATEAADRLIDAILDCIELDGSS